MTEPNPSPPSVLVEALREARLQLEYLDGRFPTGTTPAIIAYIDAALSAQQSADPSEYPERIWYTPEDNSSMQYVREDLAQQPVAPGAIERGDHRTAPAQSENLGEKK